MDVPRTGHYNIVKVNPEPGEEDERSKILVDALILPRDTLVRRAVAISGQPLAKVDPSVTDVIFVVHGIRDVAYWTQKIARRVIERANKPKGAKEKTATDRPAGSGANC